MGEEIQAIKINYIGENPEQLTDINVSKLNVQILGRGGYYYSGEAFKVDSKTPKTSKIILKIDGNKSEIISLSSNS